MDDLSKRILLNYLGDVIDRKYQTANSHYQSSIQRNCLAVRFHGQLIENRENEKKFISANNISEQNLLQFL